MMLEMANSVTAVGEAMRQRLAGLPQETCWLIAVNTQLHILEMNQIAQGTLDEVNVHPRDIFRRLIALNAYGFIVVHNHPSGSLTPSPADCQMVERLAICSSLMQMHFFDFIIVSQQGYYSWQKEADLPQISVETLFDLWTKNV